jgi:tellurite resistance protein TerC
MSVPLWLEMGTLVGFIAVLAIDFIIVERRPHAFTPAEATRWVGVYVALAFAFAVVLGITFSPDVASQFVAAYLTEYTLSVDNLFVFLVIMSAFAVPLVAQHRVLMFGILFALALRTILIVVGVQVLSAFEPGFIVFGLFLLWTAWKVATEKEEEEPKHVKDQLLVRVASRLFPTHPEYDGNRVLVTISGKRYLTPVALVMIAIGATDLMFALDSIPAVLGLTRETFLVLSSNAFALMGLRQLYFLLNGLIDRLVHLARGLSIILAFIGVKLCLMGVNSAFHTSIPDIPTLASLAVIVLVLGVTTVTSVLATRKEQDTIHGTVEDAD